MKNNIYLLLISMFVLVSSCQKAVLVPDTTGATSITSITAKFVSGPFRDQEAIRFIVNDDTDSYVIPVPWYFPEESSNETDVYMSNLKLEAALANNVSISPILGILDLTKSHSFTLTNADGSTRQISISAQRTKSNKSMLNFFSIESIGVTGLIDQNAKTVSLITAEDLSDVNVEVSISAHASVEGSLQGLDLNAPTSFTVVAHDGVAKTTYQILKTAPPKIPYGFRSGSQNLNFNLKVGDLGYSSSSKPSLAASGNFVAVSVGDGTAPKYYNRSTGRHVGSMNIGSAAANGGIASDSKGNILLMDNAANGATLRIYKSTSMTSAPTSYITWTNSSGYPISSKLSVNGNLDDKAVIIATCDAVAGVTNTKTFVRWTVTGGVVGAAEVVDAGGVPFWEAGVNGSKVSSRSNDKNDGSFLAHYDGGNDNLYYLNASNTRSLQLSAQSTGQGWGINNNLTDAKEFNNAKYLVLYCPSHFPQWGINSQLYLYDVSSMGNFSGNVDQSNAIAFKSSYGQTGAQGDPFGDVLIAPTADGYKMHVFTIDFSVGNFACYEFDCVEP